VTGQTMKKIFVIIIIALIVLSTGCHPGVQPSLSAKEYDTRLSDMRTELDLQELAEITTAMFDAQTNDFENISGWSVEQNQINRDVLRKNIMLGGRKVSIQLGLRDNRVYSAFYNFDEVTVDDFFLYKSIDDIGTDLKITFSPHGTQERTEIINEDELVEFFDNMILNKESYHFWLSWDYINSFDKTRAMNYSFHYTNDKYIGVKTSASIIFQKLASQ